ncbi:MAG: uncharacterized protein QOI24_443 [Acidobacteriota bacterium]|jgi:predicted nucleic acid-binding protein|nr:uncharacterized protein [Acidobacteriota bacterium]
MTTYFADSWFFIALIDRQDAHHRRAIRLAEATEFFVTSDAVLTEVLNYFCDHGTRSRLAAVEAVRRALRQFSVVSTDRALFKRAVDRYAARPDKQFSLTDCISMVLMEDLGITHVLTNDHHFVQAGFTIVNE